MTLEEDLEVIKKKIALREWTLGELKTFEDKFGMPTEEFVSKWHNREIPEPEDSELLTDFQEWDGLAETLEHVEGELKPLGDYLRASARSRNATV